MMSPFSGKKKTEDSRKSEVVGIDLELMKRSVMRTHFAAVWKVLVRY